MIGDIQLKFFGGVRDSIHGLILFTKLESSIINTIYMDRLKYIHNSGLNFLVFPSHTVTRYTHSLGVMHIAYRLVKTILARYIRLIKQRETWRNEISEIYNPNQVAQIVRLGALLHDIGHGPFSHTSERIMEKIVREHFKSEVQEMRKLGIMSIHEFYSYKIITENEEIKEILNDAGFNPNDVASLLVKTLVSTDGFKFKGLELLRGLISSQIDADRLDNLLRDSYSIGVPYGLVDMENIINNLYVYRSKNNLRLSFHIRALNSIEHLLDSRFKMYTWIYQHRIGVLYDHIIVESINNMLEDGYIRPEEFHFSRFVKKMGDYVDDNYVLRNLTDAIKHDKERYWISTSIFHNSNLPIPVWRSFEDLLALIQEANDKGDVFNHVRTLYQLYNYDPDGFVSELQELIADKVNSDLNIIVSSKKVPPAYKWDHGEEILILTGPNEYKEIKDISLYIRSLRDIWEKYASFYSYFYIKGKERKEFAHYLGRVREIFKEFIYGKLSQL